jgi:L,D-transpeptidase YcbB
MPKPSLPTLSPSTAETTEQAIGQYEAIVARGGWPTVPPSDLLRLGNRQPSVQVLRRRLAASGDLDVNAGIGDIFDSYVEAAVRRFQAVTAFPSTVSSANRPSTRSTCRPNCDSISSRSMSFD